jgi:hypothetical protein
VNDDMANFAAHCDVAPTLIVCMGDTLTHLTSLSSISAILRDAARVLAPGGRVVLGFRDLATVELKGLQRFISARRDPDRIFTCFLDYQSGYVEVNDLLHELADGTWNFLVNSYRKLRLDAAQVSGLLADVGLTVEHNATEQGVVRLVAAKPAS